MSETIYTTKLEVEGPWMLDRSALRELDDILSNMRKQLEIEIAQQVECELKEYQNYLDPKHEDYEQRQKERKESLESQFNLHARVGFGVSKNKIVQDISFERILGDPAFSEESPISLEAEYEMRGREYKKIGIVLNNNYSGHPKLSIELYPSTDDFLKTSYTDLKNWANKYEPSVLVKIWAKARFYAWLIWLELVLITLWIYGYSNSVDIQHKNKAISLVDGGLEEHEIAEALELILRDKFNIPFETPPEVSLGWLTVALCCGLIVCILVSFRPPLIIGVGRAEKKLKYWRRWIKFISYSFPLFIITVVATAIINTYLIPH